MRKLLILLSLLIFAGMSAGEPIVARVAAESADDLQELRRLGAAILNAELYGTVDIIIDDADIARFEEAGYTLRDIVPLSATGLCDIDPEYHTYEELTDTLQALEAQYPTLCEVDSIGHAQQFPRTIWCVKISDNVTQVEDELAVLYIGVHHACEVLGMETLIHMMSTLLGRYGIDPEITRWVDDYEIYFVPLMNPDGHYAVTESINEFWRKNARDTNNNGIYYQFQGGTWWTDVTEGIDLNRNYNWFWDMGGSGDPRSYYYRGDSPFSESENQAIRNLARERHFACGISFHSYGEVIIYPWDYNGEPCPDQEVYDVFALELAMRFIKDSGGFYTPLIYEAHSGQCRNWFYGVTGSLLFCLELMPYPIFIPPGSQLVERTERYYNGSKYLLERLSGTGITGHVYDAVTGEPVEARVEISGTISEQVMSRWNEPVYGRYIRLLNPGTYTVVSGAQGYQVQRMENIYVSDTLEVVDIYLQPAVVESEYFTGTKTLPTGTLSVKCSPNPFNAETVISINLPDAGNIEAVVFDLMGREIARIYDGYLPGGEFNFTWKGSPDTSSGIYFIAVRCGGKTVETKVLMLK